jgi:hypothetical protein
MLGHADVALQIVCGNVDKNTRLVLDSYYLRAIKCSTRFPF